jgi:hypothetical protein
LRLWVPVFRFTKTGMTKVLFAPGANSASRRPSRGTGAKGLGGERACGGAGPWGRHRQDGGAGEAGSQGRCPVGIGDTCNNP